MSRRKTGLGVWMTGSRFLLVTGLLTAVFLAMTPTALADDSENGAGQDCGIPHFDYWDGMLLPAGVASMGERRVYYTMIPSDGSSIPQIINVVWGYIDCQ